MAMAPDRGNHEQCPYPSNLVSSDDDDDIDLHMPHTNAGYKSVRMDSVLYSKYEEKVRPCIDLIDTLRALGIEKDLALPAIAVIGDQSSGKSSVLEALSGVTLPRGSGIVTRCPLELKLKKVENGTDWKGSINYDIFNQPLTIEMKDPCEVEGQIIIAQNALAGAGLGICDKLITLEIASHDMPDLTLIDLPGIARVAVGNQPKDIGDQIKRLISKYIKRQETINLVVVPSNIDIVTTEALEMARLVDPKGERTLGVLTKPDLVDRGAEKPVVDIVKNKTIPLKKGYMIVKCRGQQDIKNKLSLNEALEKEKIFFEENKHYRSLLKNELATIPVLAERLTAELVEHISKSLPLLERQIKEKLLEAGDTLEKYGKGVPEAEGERLPYLTQLILEFIKDIMKCSRGEENVFNSEKERMFTKVRSQFDSWQDSLDAINGEFKDMVKERLEEIQKRLRGRELPGFMNYTTFEDILRRQIKMMEEPAVQTLKNIIYIVQSAFNDIASDHFVNLPILRTAAKDAIDKMRRSQEEEAEKMMRTQFKMEMIVHSQDAVYFSDLKKVREEAEKDQSLPPEKKPTFSLPIEKETISLQGMSYHPEAYLKGTARRLTNQIPLIIRYYMLEEFAKNVQTEMLKLLQDKDNNEALLQENDKFSLERNELRDRIKRLNKAYTRLLQFPS